MIKYAKLINDKTKQCDVGLGINMAFYQSVGMTLKDVEQGFDGNWYLAGFAPTAPDSSYALLRQRAYRSIEDQLDSLYHDIEGGLLGEAAKASAFYSDRRRVKEAYPKPNESVLDSVQDEGGING